MKAFLDACVLYPTVVREILLGCAQKKLFEPLWSPRVLDEWSRAEIKNGMESTSGTEIALMTATWPMASFEPRASDQHRLVLPDPNDVHVLASAIAGSADVLVTFNAKDFPRHTLNQEGLFRQDPDSFLLSLFTEDSEDLDEIATNVFAKAVGGGAPFQNPWELIKKARLPRLAKALRNN